jgi:hypothetical protein
LRVSETEVVPGATDVTTVLAGLDAAKVTAIEFTTVPRGAANGT